MLHCRDLILDLCYDALIFLLVLHLDIFKNITYVGTGAVKVLMSARSTALVIVRALFLR